jgi:hypothetical protein
MRFMSRSLYPERSEGSGGSSTGQILRYAQDKVGGK